MIWRPTLSFFVWGSMPDAELLRRRRRARCARRSASTSQMEAAAHTMRARNRCRRASRAQWLRLQDVDKVRPDHHFYSYWDTTLSQAMVRETELFVDSLIREDRR
jgi:hypothetical protein